MADQQQQLNNNVLPVFQPAQKKGTPSELAAEDAANIDLDELFNDIYYAELPSIPCSIPAIEPAVDVAIAPAPAPVVSQADASAAVAAPEETIVAEIAPQTLATTTTTAATAPMDAGAADDAPFAAAAAAVAPVAAAAAAAVAPVAVTAAAAASAAAAPQAPPPVAATMAAVAENGETKKRSADDAGITAAPVKSESSAAASTAAATVAKAAATSSAAAAAAAADTTESGGKEELTEQQKIERRERNREHAKRSRLRKKFLLESLQEQIHGLEEQIESFKNVLKEQLPDRAEELIGRICGDKEKYTPLPMPSGFGPVKTLMEPDFRLMSALSGSQQNFAISDPTLPDNPIVYCSQGFLDLTGYTLDQVLGRNCRFLQGPGTDQSAVEVIRRGIKEGVDTSVCLLNYRADGTPFWNQFFVAALRDAQNNIVNFVGVQCEVSKAIVEKHMGKEATKGS